MAIKLINYKPFMPYFTPYLLPYVLFYGILATGVPLTGSSLSLFNQEESVDSSTQTTEVLKNIFAQQVLEHCKKGCHKEHITTEQHITKTFLYNLPKDDLDAIVKKTMLQLKKNQCQENIELLSKNLTEITQDIVLQEKLFETNSTKFNTRIAELTFKIAELEKEKLQAHKEHRDLCIILSKKEGGAETKSHSDCATACILSRIPSDP